MAAALKSKPEPLSSIAAAKEMLAHAVQAANLTGDPLRHVLEAQLLTLDAQDQVAQRVERGILLDDERIEKLGSIVARRLVPSLRPRFCLRSVVLGVVFGWIQALLTIAVMELMR